MMDIKTLVFFDCETTGLPAEENNTTRMTELCLIAIQSDHIGVSNRIQNKITICFNPKKTIHPKAAELTGLSTQLLEGQFEFNNAMAKLIQDFLNLQHKPICMIAHNGNKFDFPILKAEIHKAGNNLAEDILYADSIDAFKCLETERNHIGWQSYKLAEVYKRLKLRYPENAHTAEGDVNILIECVHTFGNEFVDWCNRYARKLCDISMMEPGKPIGL